MQYSGRDHGHQLVKRVAKSDLDGAKTLLDADPSETLRRLREQNEDAETNPVEPKPVSSELDETTDRSPESH